MTNDPQIRELILDAQTWYLRAVTCQRRAYALEQQAQEMMKAAENGESVGPVIVGTFEPELACGCD